MNITKVAKNVAKVAESLSYEIALTELQRTYEKGFIQAESLFNAGCRLKGWGLELTDTNNQTTLKTPNTYREWYDGGGRNVDEAYEILDLEPNEYGYCVLKYLDDLTAEEAGEQYVVEKLVRRIFETLVPDPKEWNL